MPVTVTYSADVSAIDSALEALIFLPDVVAEVGDNILEDLRSDLLPQLQKEPPKRQYPADYPNGRLPFDTPKQQRWYWANIGKPYTRTGKLAQSWFIESKQSRQTYRFIVGNPANAAKFV